jgi:hypothetical protein
MIKMKLGEHKGLILIIIGILLSMTLYLIFFGIPLIIFGTYYLNKKVNQREKEINEKLNDKKAELANIDNKLKEMEKEKEREINIKLKEKETQLTNIDVELEEKAKIKEKEINKRLNDKKTELAKIDNGLKQGKKRLILVEDELEIQEAGLYEPKYDFLTAVLFKEKLDEIRKKQKELIKNKKAAICETEWTIDGNRQKGIAFSNSQKKQILKNFNLECEIAINKVTYSNRKNSIKRIKRTFDTLNKLNERNSIRINPQYLDLKLQELDIAFEYELKKQEEKELLREAKEQEREEQKIQKELDAQEKKINEENKSLETEINKIIKELKSKSDEEKEKLELKIKKLELTLAKSNEALDQIANKRKRTGAGYVYILSNIGSFGENIYKIGVTRRDEPQDRVKELSNASVPFKFDTQVFIFSKEAFELEKELHNRFDNKRVNKINSRKEFFNITVDDIKKIVEENK